MTVTIMACSMPNPPSYIKIFICAGTQQDRNIYLIAEYIWSVIGTRRSVYFYCCFSRNETSLLHPSSSKPRNTSSSRRSERSCAVASKASMTAARLWVEGLTLINLAGDMFGVTAIESLLLRIIGIPQARSRLR